MATNANQCQIEPGPFFSKLHKLGIRDNFGGMTAQWDFAGLILHQLRGLVAMTAFHPDSGSGNTLFGYMYEFRVVQM